MSLSVIARSVLIALIAGVAAWLPFTLDVVFWSGSAAPSNLHLLLLAFALCGSLLIGLPIALVTFHLAWKQLVHAPLTLAMIASLSGVMMMLTSFVLWGEPGLVTIGLPSFIAAGTFGLLGWLWIIKPIGQMEERSDNV